MEILLEITEVYLEYAPYEAAGIFAFFEAVCRKLIEHKE